MKNKPYQLILAMLLGGSAAMAQDNAPAAPPPVPAAATPATTGGSTNDAPAVQGSSTNGLNINFRNAPIDLALNYLSDAAGFIVQLDSVPHGTVNVRGQNLTREEVYQLINSELNKAGYAAIRNGRTLRIMDKPTAKSANNPVKYGNAPDDVPDNDEMVTQIIPIRFVEAGQLVSDISPFVSSGATIIANQAGNSIVITDTQSNIRHLMEIIKAIDSSAEDVTEVKVFRLQHADPTEMANLLSGLFPDQSGSSAPIRFGNRGGGNRGGGAGGGFNGGGFGGRGGFGGFGGFNPFAAALGAGNQGNAQTDRIRNRNKVMAVADPRTSSVVVTCTRDLMEQITEMVDQLDHPGRMQQVQVISVNNADPDEVLSALQDTFGASTSRNTRNNQTSPFQSRIQQNQNNTRTGSQNGGISRTGGGNRTGGGFGGGF